MYSSEKLKRIKSPFNYTVLVVVLLLSSCTTQIQPVVKTSPYSNYLGNQDRNTIKEKKCETWGSDDISEKLKQLDSAQKSCSESSKRILLEAGRELSNFDLCGMKEDMARADLRAQLGRIDRKLDGYHHLQNISSWFNIADTALSQSCLDIADKVYRNILYEKAPYIQSNPNYESEAEGIKDRARLGIDDIREIKKSKYGENGVW